MCVYNTYVHVYNIWSRPAARQPSSQCYPTPPETTPGGWPNHLRPSVQIPYAIHLYTNPCHLYTT